MKPGPTNHASYFRGALDGATRGARRVLGSARLRGEIAWVVGHRIVEFVVIFVGIKLLTQLLGKSQFGEHTLAIAATQLIAAVLIMPMNQAYLRYYHTAYEQGAQGAAGRRLFKWYAWATLVPLAVGAAATVPLAYWFHVAALTPLATALWFATDRWRNLALEIFELRRERSSTALFSMSYQLANVLALFVGLLFLTRSAWVAIVISSALAALWALASLRPEWQRIRSAPAAVPDQLPGLVRTFGLPAAALLICQWLQSNVDRYLLAAYLSKGDAGVYVAATQVFGAPTLLMINIMTWLVMPVAFQRARDVTNPAQLWAADKVILLGVGLYMVVGTLVLPICFFLGPSLLTLMTSSEFQLTGVQLTLIAATRLLQGAVILLQMVFAVHQQMTSSLALRVAGALIAVPSIWVGVMLGGLSGAAWAAAASSLAYLILLLFGPAGGFRLIRGNRARIGREGQSI